MTIPTLPPLERTSPSFAADLDAFFLTQLPATIPAFNAEISRINGIGFGSYSGSSTTNIVSGPGSKTFTVETGKSFTSGQYLMAASVSSPSVFMSGQVTSYDPLTGALVLSVTDTGGAGTTKADWSIAPSAVVLRPTKVGDVFQGAVKPTADTWLPLAGGLYLQSSYAELYSLLGLLPDNLAAIQTAVARTMPSSSAWSAVAYGNGVFVAVANSTTAAATSPDGITWTARTMPSSIPWSSVAYGNGVFVAVANHSASSSVATSPDGITWTARTVPTTLYLGSVAYGNGVFVAPSRSSSTCVVSSDGITWTSHNITGGGGGGWESIGFGNGVFVVTYNGLVSYVVTSPDGVTWTNRTMPSSQRWKSVAYGNGVFVAIVQNSAVAATSPDGITWTARTLPSSGNRIAIAFGGGLFYVPEVGTIAYTSPDGITWATRSLPSSQSWLTTAYGNGVFVAVANGTTAAASAGPIVTYDSTTQFYLPASVNTPGIAQWIRGL